MTDRTQPHGPSREWLLKMADSEDCCRSVSAGGMAADMGLLTNEAPEPGHVFGRFIEFARRSRGLSIEQFARDFGIELAELVAIETNPDSIPQRRTILELAKVLDLPSDRLIEIAGLVTPPPDVRTAALKFAARSEPVAELSPQELEAYEDFVKVLVGNSEVR